MKLPNLKKQMLVDVSSNKVLSIVTYATLGLVALVMTVLNILTDKGILTYATGIFTVLCLFSLLFTLIGKVTAAIAKGLFAVGVLVLFSFFLISGNPDGFSPIWICMLPSLGMFFFNRFRGTILCIVMFLILAFFLWIPYGQSLLLFDYTDTFRMRFPILFVAFHLLAFLLETLRVNAAQEAQRLQNYYHDLSIRDQLTGMLNRQGMYSLLENDDRYKKASKIGVAILDIDRFKEVNDQYGHNVGDVVLRELSALIKANVDSLVCRWGGEEFVVVFTEDSILREGFELIRKKVAQYDFCTDEVCFNISVSIGVCTAEDFSVYDIDRLIERADGALYAAKSAGRNQVVYFDDLDKKPYR